ncbi:hypothetical protein [Roseinatronobacter sp. S2]|uniref:hypothetical protein n=1 Tax=Roseinatronobacter sp. S2 TaxID=3035471 RepID=UPI00240E9F76|nr:hypothetical protein [Roseinatronobacter sp. S2]WFE75172.1 hypothetical protein P8S53_01835 [Roseinatronobacter sp. S2]
MSVVFFREENREKIETALQGLPFLQSGKHSKNLSHYERIFLARTIAKLPVGMVGVISNKLSLLEYLPQASSTPTHYYNKVSQYLLERVSNALSVCGISRESVSIRLEARDQQYSSLISFVKRIQTTPLDHRAASLRGLNPFSIIAVKKKDDRCFILADCASNALFSMVCRDEKRFCLPEPRYLQELAPIILSNKQGEIMPFGIKPIHKLEDLGLPEDVKLHLKALRNPQRQYHLLTT